MKLDDFITETLLSILEGVAKAQAMDGGRSVNATGWKGTAQGLYTGYDESVFTVVSFDVAVSVSEEANASAGVKAWINVQAGGGRESSQTSRVAFTVPVRLPQGDETARQKRDEERQNRPSLGDIRSTMVKR